MSRREHVKYPNLNPSYNLKSRHDDIIDVLEYWDELSEEEKKWMHKFMAEYNNNDFSHEDPLHNTIELKKACRRRNNAKFADLYTKEKAKSRLGHLEEYHQTDNDMLDYSFDNSELEVLIEKNSNDNSKE